MRLSLAGQLDDALELLELVEPDVQTVQELALAFRRANRHDEAHSLLEALAEKALRSCI